MPANCEISHTPGAVFGGQPHPWTKMDATPPVDLTEPGNYELLVGASSADIRAQAVVRVDVPSHR